MMITMMIERNREENLNYDILPQFFFPVDLLPIILSYYTNTFQGLFLFSLICRSWKTVADHSRIWKECELSFKLETWNRSLQRQLMTGIRIHQISLNDLPDIHFRIDVDYVIVIREPSQLPQADTIHQSSLATAETPLEPSQIRQLFLTFLINYKKLYQYYAFVFQLFQICEWCKGKRYHISCAIMGITFLVTVMFIFAGIPDCFEQYWLSNLLYLFLELGCILCVFFGLVEELNYRARKYQDFGDFKKNMIEIIILIFILIYSLLGVIAVIFMFIINLLIHFL